MRRSSVLNALFLRGARLANQTILRPFPQGDDFDGKPHPTEFRFLNRPYGEVLERNCHLGQRTRIDFATDVQDDYFDRAILPGSLDVRIYRDGNPIASPEYTYVMRLSSGIAHLSIDLPPSVVDGDQLIVEVCVNDETLIAPFVNRTRIAVLPEQKTQSGGGNRRRRGSGNARLSLTPSGIEFPQIDEIREERWAANEMDKWSALRVVNLGKDEASDATKYLFAVNMDNEYLRAERRSTPRKKDLLDAQWKYGLVLFGLGLLREPDKEASEVAEQMDKRERVAALAIALPAAAVFAHDFSQPYKWDTGDTITVESRIPQSADVHAAADDYDDNTDLAVNRCSPDSNCGNVIHYDGYHGPAEAPAWADPLSQLEPCSDDDHVVNGYCNETNHKVDFSYIYYNTAHNYAPLVAVITLHEMGHVWGLDHTSCSTVSVMKPGPGTCSGSVQYAFLQQHDIDDINAKY